MRLRNLLLLLGIIAEGICSNIFSQEALQNEKEYFLSKGYIPLAGIQEGDYESNRYVIISDLIIPDGKSVNFFPGSTIFVKKNISISVNGKLILSGKKNEPIKITTLPHNEYKYGLDSSVYTYWEGIRVNKNSVLELNYCTIENVKLAINAEKNSTVILDSVKFKNVKYTYLKYGNKIIKFPENKSIYFNSQLNDKVKIVKVKTKLSREKRIKITFNIATGLLTVFSAGVSVYCAKKTYDYKKKYDNSTSPFLAEHYRKKTNTWYKYTVISSAGTLLAGTGTVFTFTINRKH